LEDWAEIMRAEINIRDYSNGWFGKHLKVYFILIFLKFFNFTSLFFFAILFINYILDVLQVRTFSAGFLSMLRKIKKMEQLFVKKCLKKSFFMLLMKLKQEFSM
jgi:hypothetical protein